MDEHTHWDKSGATAQAPHNATGRTWVGIDVSQAKLDVAIDGQAEIRVFENQEAGWEQLACVLRTLSAPRCVLEASGGYQDGCVRALQGQGLSVCVCNARQVRDFAKATGKLAKTDSLDARVLVHFAKAVGPAETPVVSCTERVLKSLTRRRKQLVEQRAQEKKRHRQERDPAAIDSIEQHIAWLDTEVARLDEAIEQTIAQDTKLEANSRSLQSVPGVGPAVSSIVLAEMPELGSISHKQAAALAGLAPFNHDSGKLRGKRHIRAGRTPLRTILYCAAVVAATHNPVLRDFYQRLLANGKPKKLAFIAVARKILAILNAIVREQKQWNVTNPKYSC